MDQEENIHRSSYNNSGGGSGGGGCGGEGGGGSSGRSKKVKQKKVPQRGLGVAQLEKIRLEEQQNKDAALQATDLLAKSIVSHSEANFRPNFSPPSNSISLAPPSPNDLPLPNSSYNLAQSIPNIEFLHPNSVQFSKSLNVGGGEIGMAAGNTWPRLWNGEYNLEGRDLQGFTIRPHENFPYESNPTGVLPLLGEPQRVHQFQPPASSSLVNASSGISSSSVLNFQMEPPSNQNYLGNNYRPFWPEDEKMVGIKRSYPFSMETPPAPSFLGKIHHGHLITISGSDESCSCSNRCTTQMEPSIKIYSRECPSTPIPLPERNPSELIRENRGLSGDFLTLAPPSAAASSSLLNSKHKGQHGQDLSDSEYFHCQESAKDPNQSLMEQPPFTFFPSNVQIGQGTTYVDNGNGEKQVAIDLNLKL
ncbi:Hypothetical predicted protein [Olea europaea subsp. europaea]|uniref:Uncharacterized protein n=2 Tax=Olea europaea subsp. europaea TaxID=158383 RepID=A0A8S0TU39_OLEEU|nr:Hypothetical predicted protein [Olea europaea subsp. europaea]